MNRSKFIEQEAILLALEDTDADSGNHDPLDRYIVENFLPGERRKLSEAAELLAERAWHLRDHTVEELADDADGNEALVARAEAYTQVVRLVESEQGRIAAVETRLRLTVEDYEATKAKIAACPTQMYHETHCYCPSCPWTEDWQKLEDCDPDCILDAGHDGQCQDEVGFRA